MPPTHPEPELILYLRDELAPPDRERVAGHLEVCADCRRALAEFRGLLEDLTRSVPRHPEIHWGRYGAELRAKLERRGRRWRWWLRPVPLALTAGLAGILLLLAHQAGVRQVGRADDLTAFEETVIGSRLDLLREYALLERLDLLEDLELIRQLDRLSPTREG
jgi:anti-sigma factor RsiW